MKPAPRVVVTGVDGLLGRRFACAYGGRFDLVGVSRRDGAPGGVALLRADLASDDLDAALAGPSPDAVVHLAGRLVGSDEQSWRDNVLATRALVAWARRRGVARFVFASSAAVYGDAGASAVDERAPRRAEGAYALAKAAAEDAVATLGDAGASVATLRLSHVYAPEKTVGVVAAVVRALAARRPVVLDGTGDERRDFVHANDAVAAVALALEAEPRGGVEVLNVGSGESPTLREAVAVMADAWGAPATIELSGRPASAPRDVRLDVEAAARRLGFRAEISLGEGVRAWREGREPRVAR